MCLGARSAREGEAGGSVLDTWTYSSLRLPGLLSTDILQKMKLPTKAIIAAEKLKDYLLIPQPINDKSRFLALAGYTQDNWHRLEQDLRTQILTCEAQLQETTS